MKKIAPGALLLALAVWIPLHAAAAPIQPVHPDRVESFSGASNLTTGRSGEFEARMPVYALSPSELVRSRSLYYWRTGLDFASSFWSILVLLAILYCGWAANLREWAISRSRRKWAQGLCFFPSFLLLISVLHLPLALLAHHISLAYGQSIEGWRSWFLDWGKALLLDLLVGTLVLSVAFILVRASRRWWLWVWLLSLPAQLLVVFILPVIVDPFFNHFEPLGDSNPALVRQLEQIVAKASVNIPPSRMYLMKASEKVTGSNAYVTGFGASKRVVIWDTTIKRLPADEILVIFGHELGHYVLNHIRKGLLIGAVLSFFFVWAGFHLALFLVRRCASHWRIRSIEDWASAAVLLLVLNILAFAAQPLGNGISRVQEHQADIFGEEVVHGIVADPQKAAADSFQHLGEEFLDYPDPNPFVVFWTYSHPPTSDRMAFAAGYDPWRPGKQPRYFKKD